MGESVLRKIIKFLVSVEFFFTLFLFSGYFKEGFNMSLDLTAILLVITMILVLVKVYFSPEFNKNNLIPIYIFLLLYIFLILSLYYSPSPYSSLNKVIKFTFLTLPSFLIPLISFKGMESLKKVAISIAIISIVFALSVIPALISNSGTIGFVGSQGQYQSIGRMMGVGCIILIFYFAINKNNKVKLFGLISTLLCMVVLLGSGSRMPLISLTIVALYFFVTSFKIKNGTLFYRKELKLFSLLLLLMLPMIWFFFQKGYFVTVIYRLSVLFNEKGGGVSAIGRTDAFETAINTWKSNPLLGSGVGSFGFIQYGYDKIDYPHNILIELLMEQGLIGFSLFLILFSYVALKCFGILKTESIHYIVWVLIFLNFFLNSLVSGDINSNRMLFTAMSFVIIAYNNYVVEEINSPDHFTDGKFLLTQK